MHASSIVRLGGVDTMPNLRIFTDDIEGKAQSQIYELLSQPAFKDAKVRIMPDVHAGAGCVIGFTADLGDKVIPNIVGVDIGCGVRVVEIGKADIDLRMLDEFIKGNIPSGFAVNPKAMCPFDATSLICHESLQNKQRLALGIGSLGGGNHFIEVDEDQSGNKYLVIHTGSRNLGKQVADIYQNRAIEYCRGMEKPLIDAKVKELKSQGRQLEIDSALKEIHERFRQYSVPKELCYLEGKGRDDYLHDMRICQEYAVRNRDVIAKRIVEFLGIVPVAQWESVHNYIDDSNMIRKGAISAHKGQKVIIPLNMRDGSIIGIGLGNEEWNESAPHGAGRLMSRGEAKRSLSVEEFEDAMSGIYTTTANQSTIDEAPMAYKPAQEIVDAISDTVSIASIIRPIYNFKAAGD